MCNRMICLVSGVLLVGLLGATAVAQNQILNWEFDEPMDLDDVWNFWRSEHFASVSIVEGAGLSGKYAMKIDIGTGPFDPLQVFQSNLMLEQGATYTISFMAKADAPRTVTVQLQARSNHSPAWYVYWQEADLQLTTEPQTFTFEYTHTGATVGGTSDWLANIDLHWLLVGDGTDLYLDHIWLGVGPPPPPLTAMFSASEPDPADAATDVPREVVLSWTPGEFAQA
ncbi:MAG: carbohydrate binding domain-containing protein, partial [Phycisphaerales bacterium]